MCVAFAQDGRTLASAGRDQTVKLWEIATGRERATLKGHTEPVHSVAFQPNGSTLASASYDNTVKLWNTMPIKKVGFSADDLWTDLAGQDAVQAYQTIGILVGAPDQAVSLIKGRLRAVTKPNPQEIANLLADLDNDRFAVRENATKELEKMADQVERALRSKLAEKHSAEAEHRIEELLVKLEPQSWRTVRAMEVLEYIGNAEARKVLERLATGADGASLTEEAKASLARLKKRTAADN
jgi:hypothetical protein